MLSAMKQVKQLKISGWPTIFGGDQKNLSFWPFLAFGGRLGGLKDPLEVQVQHETYRSMSETHVQAILSRVGGGAQEWPKSVKIWLLLCGLATFGEKPIFSIFGPIWSKSLRNGPKRSKSGIWQFFTIWDHFWMIWTN